MIYPMTDLEAALDAANNDRQELHHQLEAVADRAYGAELRLVVVQGVASKLLARTGAPVSLESVVEQVNAGLASDMIREQERHARTRERLEDAIHRLDEMQRGARTQSALERELARRAEPPPFDELLDDTIDTHVQEVPCSP